MAEDFRDTSQPAPDGSSQPPSETGPKRPKHEFPKSQVGKLWDAFGNPEEPVNLMPGGTYNSAGGKPKEVTVMDAVKSLSTNDFTSFYKAPCARDSLLVGIGTGFGIGSLRVVLGGLRSLWAASNWAVGSFAVASILTHQYCQRKRVKEMDGMKEAVQLMRELKIKKQKEQAEAQRKQEEEARLAEEERKRKSWTNLSSYKFW
ncbi:hypothetical protein CPC735_046160 [Coccidioides posadasii C735 delta SOWgp]|uniref:Cytochrome c oxidase assembly protein COX20, mitochondrial n=3 Tax=Coccidioides posadasii TaxID=199306 RepID=E9D9V0_COCPS|nr:hypothetical protein CPC735_046160 [Coccidioides posadasii C735 delta SOWgp]EER23246.1 hypothetical protein CPC735_046160 [Coccidioides posadasii C735 delta SOWgp]EFW16681.1 conserved hypothetical protein [Coccidioides posadasii str. Silveira]|eukprot:XP_003065391.1 hypothetical protein CPC735_046160 [Coccidioides posadasii C735 delta SOWgp]